MESELQAEFQTWNSKQYWNKMVESFVFCFLKYMQRGTFFICIIIYFLYFTLYFFIIIVLIIVFKICIYLKNAFVTICIYSFTINIYIDR